MPPFFLNSLSMKKTLWTFETMGITGPVMCYIMGEFNFAAALLCGNSNETHLRNVWLELQFHTHFIVRTHCKSFKPYNEQTALLPPSLQRAAWDKIKTRTNNVWNTERKVYFSNLPHIYIYISDIIFTWIYEWHQELVSIPNTWHMFYKGYLMSWDKPFVAYLTVIRLLSHEDMHVWMISTELRVKDFPQRSRLCVCARARYWTWKLQLSLNAFPQNRQTSFSPVWISQWDLRESLLVIAFPHTSQMKWFSPVWDFMCRDKEVWYVNILPHSSHWHGFPSCFHHGMQFFLCAVKLLQYGKDKPYMLHLNGRAPVWMFLCSCKSLFV